MIHKKKKKIYDHKKLTNFPSDYLIRVITTPNVAFNCSDRSQIIMYSTWLLSIYNYLIIFLNYRWVDIQFVQSKIHLKYKN